MKYTRRFQKRQFLKSSRSRSHGGRQVVYVWVLPREHEDDPRQGVHDEVDARVLQGDDEGEQLPRRVDEFSGDVQRSGHDGVDDLVDKLQGGVDDSYLLFLGQLGSFMAVYSNKKFSMYKKRFPCLGVAPVNPWASPGMVIDYRCDNARFWLSAHNCQVPTPTSQNLDLEQQIRISEAD